MKNKLYFLSVLISSLSIAASIAINIEIAKEYLRVGRKTQILFSIKEQYEFSYQYSVVALGIIALVLSVMGLVKKIFKTQKYLPLFLSLFAIGIVFFRIWRLFI